MSASRTDWLPPIWKGIHAINFGFCSKIRCQSGSDSTIQSCCKINSIYNFPFWTSETSVPKRSLRNWWGMRWPDFLSFNRLRPLSLPFFLLIQRLKCCPLAEAGNAANIIAIQLTSYKQEINKKFISFNQKGKIKVFPHRIAPFRVLVSRWPVSSSINEIKIIATNLLCSLINMIWANDVKLSSNADDRYGKWCRWDVNNPCGPAVNDFWKWFIF